VSVVVTGEVDQGLVDIIVEAWEKIKKSVESVIGKSPGVPGIPRLVIQYDFVEKIADDMGIPAVYDVDENTILISAREVEKYLKEAGRDFAYCMALGMLMHELVHFVNYWVYRIASLEWEEYRAFSCEVAEELWCAKRRGLLDWEPKEDDLKCEYIPVVD
jgi:hypothetical protein